MDLSIPHKQEKKKGEEQKKESTSQRATQEEIIKLPEATADSPSKKNTSSPEGSVRLTPSEFASMVARELMKNLSMLRPSKPFVRDLQIDEIGDIPAPEGQNLTLIDTSVLIDGRILPVVNSGFMSGTLLVPQFVLGEIQHIADSSDSLRRAKGRRGLDIVQKLMNQKVNDMVVTKVIKDDIPTIPEVDHKLAALAKKWKTKLITVDFNLAQLARVEGIKVLNVHDLAQAIKLAVMPGEELTIKITHEGKEREQGVGYLPDGTMVIVDNAKQKVGLELVVVISRIVNTPAGQLFFARLK